MTTLLYSHPVFGRHEVPPGHVEHPGRYAAVDDALKAEAFAELDRRIPPLASAEQVERVHTPMFRKVVEENAPSEGLAQFDADTFMPGRHLLEATLRAAGGACAAVDALYAGEAKNAFVCSRVRRAITQSLNAPWGFASSMPQP